MKQPAHARTKRLDRRADRRVSPRALDTPWLTSEEAVRYLKLGSLSALYRAIREHRCPFGRLGEQYRFHRDQLDAWLAGVNGATALRLLRAARG